MSAPQQVHLRFSDAAGQQIAVRLRVTNSQGEYRAPFGRLAHFATEPGVDVGANVLLDDGPWAIIDGACEIELPPGPLKIQARKGPEYRPFDVDVVLHPGKMSLRFTMERWIDLGAEGWYAGDTCCYEMSPHAALLEALANDVAVVDLLIRERSGLHLFHPPWEAEHGGPAARLLGAAGLLEPAAAQSLPNIAAYSGQSPALAKSGHMVVVNTANQSPHGRLLLLNTHRTVYPLSFEKGEKWSLIDWCDQCHRKKGLVIADDWLPRLAEKPIPELLDADFLRRVDAVRFHPDVPLEPWFDALRRGIKLPLVAGSGKESNRGLLGSWRTYAHVPQFDYANWTEAIRSGRTFVTNGPILRWLPGDVPSVEAVCATPLDRLQILADGRVIAETTGPSERLRLDAKAEGVLVARCEGAGGALAITSPRAVGVSA